MTLVSSTALMAAQHALRPAAANRSFPQPRASGVG
jgi:hypothetical protein